MIQLISVPLQYDLLYQVFVSKYLIFSWTVLGAFFVLF
jgi:hypothetical protein